MGKKTIEDAILIKRLLDKKMKAWQISKKYGIKKQKFSYWKHHEIKTVIKRRSKLTDEDIKYMIQLVENKITSEMSSRKITLLINKRFKEKGRDLKISHMAKCRILNKNIGKPRKIQKVCSINQKKKMKE